MSFAAGTDLNQAPGNQCELDVAEDAKGDQSSKQGQDTTLARPDSETTTKRLRRQREGGRLIEEVQRGWLLADATITKTVEKFEESGEVPKPDSSKRGRGSEKWQARREAYVKVKKSHVERIKKYIDGRRMDGGTW